MTGRRAFSAILTRRAAMLWVGSLVLILSVALTAQVDSRRIDEVIKKNVLGQEDFAIIDAFVTDAVGRLVRTVDFTEVAKARASIVGHQNTQAQYAQRFSDACLREIGEGFNYATTQISDPQRRFKVFTNLLILINELNDPRLVDLAVGMIGHEAGAVRYWAVRAATNPGAWDQLSRDQAAAAAMSGKIIDACSKVADSSNAETLRLMAEFAGRYATAPATELLSRIAEARIRHYADWNVKYELVDTDILKMLSNRITAGGTGNEQLARQFAQLYSYAIQRYIRGMQNNTLRGLSRHYLAAVLIETEEQCLSKLLGGTQTGIRRALEAGDLNALQAEHDRLLGGANQPGALPGRFNFSYGTGANSSPTPLPLPDPQQSKTAAETQPPAQP